MVHIKLIIHCLWELQLFIRSRVRIWKYWSLDRAISDTSTTHRFAQSSRHYSALEMVNTN